MTILDFILRVYIFIVAAFLIFVTYAFFVLIPNEYALENRCFELGGYKRHSSVFTWQCSLKGEMK